MVATKPVDFRKGAEGLAALVREEMKADPFSGAVYVFRAKRTDRVKLVFWDGTGVCLFAKRLEDGEFRWPKVQDGVMRLSAAQLYRNIPACESDESSTEVIQVLDPRHPLYGRSFRVIRRSTHGGGNLPPSYEVEYLNGSTLLIPVAATEQCTREANQLKLSIEALRDLVCAVECLGDHEHGPKGPLGNVAAGIAAPDRRGRCRGPGGGLS
jgi:transposase